MTVSESRVLFAIVVLMAMPVCCLLGVLIWNAFNQPAPPATQQYSFAATGLVRRGGQVVKLRIYITAIEDSRRTGKRAKFEAVSWSEAAPTDSSVISLEPETHYDCWYPVDLQNEAKEQAAVLYLKDPFNIGHNGDEPRPDKPGVQRCIECHNPDRDGQELRTRLRDVHGLTGINAG